MRAVFDTNIILSAALWGGPPRHALQAIREGHATLISSDELIEELKTVLARAKFVPRLAEINRTADELIADYQQLAEMTVPADVGRVVPNDSKDDKFIACAVGGRATLVVSGDSHLLRLGQYDNIEVITVQQFLERIYPPDE
ncbi:MAG: putative toxin-antitoxin system toxin component, PIN family protein [Chloroflexota bacterium]|nr:MAG: putative toxin-antitoxin system toxin component, PIN family protein [Chloroflexota bacterium]